MTYSLILRGPLGRKLSIEEMDDNLLYLQQLALSNTGPTGPQGSQGFNGADGEPGEIGLTGPQGYQGPPAGSYNPAFINYTFNGATLSSTASVFFCNSSYHYTTVNLPNVTEMTGKELKFISVDNDYEGLFNINGPFYDESTYYNLNGFGHTLTIISDGSVWWILNQFVP